MTPRLLSTWSFGTIGSPPAWRVLHAGGSALDAVVAGATAVELDPTVRSVGLGGRPDADGTVSLDASVMTDPDRCGAVACLRRHVHAAAIARRVMEKALHILVAADGADEFAEREGFPATTLLTDEMRARWQTWRARHRPDPHVSFYGWLPPANIDDSERPQGEHHPPAGGDQPRHPPADTVCYLARDRAGRLAGACTTSGVAYKLPGRVGDSPILGHGLYVDQHAGAAAATGHGELIMRVCGSFLVVELMRQGASPAEACIAALRRIADRCELRSEHEVAFIALTPPARGDTWASAALRPGFVHVVTDDSGTRVEPAQSVLLK